MQDPELYNGKTFLEIQLNMPEDFPLTFRSDYLKNVQRVITHQKSGRNLHEIESLKNYNHYLFTFYLKHKDTPPPEHNKPQTYHQLIYNRLIEQPNRAPYLPIYQMQSGEFKRGGIYSDDSRAIILYDKTPEGKIQEIGIGIY